MMTPDESRAILGAEAEGMTDEELLQLSALADLICDLAIELAEREQQDQAA